MHKVVSLSLLIFSAAPVSVQAAAPPAANVVSSDAAKYSVETTELGVMLDDSAAKAILVRHLPDMMRQEQITMARGLTLKQLQNYAGDQVTDEVLEKIQADLAQLPPKK